MQLEYEIGQVHDSGAYFGINIEELPRKTAVG